MSTNLPRRSLLKGLLLAPLALVIPRLALSADPAPTAKPAAAGAKPANALAETDPLANAMKYKEDAAKAAPFRTDKTAFCSNCAKYNKCSPADNTCKPGSKTAAYAPCEVFAGKTVAKGGWCMSWSKS
jgi:hypothetical protein